MDLYPDFARTINAIEVENANTKRAITEAIMMRFLSDHEPELFTAIPIPSILTIAEAMLATSIIGNK